MSADKKEEQSAAESDSPPKTIRALPTEVVTHPLVLLSAVDHYNRVLGAKSKKRVVGILLGSSYKGKVDVTNSFAVPFEEDLKNPTVWYLDHNYLEKMWSMFRKINAKERIVGFYSTGPKIREADLDIDQMMRKYCPNPVLVIIDVRPDVEGLPTKAYGSIEEVEQDGKVINRSFKHISCNVGAFEAEEVGVEHLLRDINDPSLGSLSNQVKHTLAGLTGLKEKLEEMSAYLQNVLDKKLPANNQIIYNMQTIFNLLPNLNVEELVKSMFVKTNDFYMTMYVSALVRCVIALHNLVNNKIKYKDMDEEPEKNKQKEPEKKDNDGSKAPKKTSDTKTAK